MWKLLSAISLTTCMALATSPNTPLADEPEPELCYVSAWKVESATVYGDRASIMGKLEKYTKVMELPKHRVYLFSIESAEGAELTTFEFAKQDEAYTVTTYAAESTSELMNEVNDAVLASEGNKCVGEMAKEILGKKFADKKKGDSRKVPVKEAGTDAFKKALEGAKGQFFRVTFTVLC